MSEQRSSQPIERMAQTIFDNMRPLLLTRAESSPTHRVVLALSGGSGTGKTTIARILQEKFTANGLPALVLGGDHFPRRIPRLNDAERLSRFRDAGLQALVFERKYSSSVRQKLLTLWRTGRDAAEEEKSGLPWLRVYQEAGKEALRAYLGTPEEIDFELMNRTVAAYLNGDKRLWVRELGREPDEMRYEEQDISNIRLLIIEWTHAGSEFLNGTDVRVLLHATPEQTLMNRLRRGRDPGADSPFTAMVLSVEQEKLRQQAKRADLIVSRNGEILSLAEVLYE